MSTALRKSKGKIQVTSVYPETRAGADGTRVNFFFVKISGWGQCAHRIVRITASADKRLDISCVNCFPLKLVFSAFIISVQARQYSATVQAWAIQPRGGKREHRRRKFRSACRSARINLAAQRLEIMKRGLSVVIDAIVCERGMGSSNQPQDRALVICSVAITRAATVMTRISRSPGARLSPTHARSRVAARQTSTTAFCCSGDRALGFTCMAGLRQKSDLATECGVISVAIDDVEQQLRSAFQKLLKVCRVWQPSFFIHLARFCEATLRIPPLFVAR